MTDKEIHFKPGLTWRSILALIFAIVLFVPSSIYLNLTVGGGIAAASFIIAIIFSELTRYFGKPLTKQELFIMFAVIDVVTVLVPPYYWIIWRTFYCTHPLFSEVTLFGKKLVDLVPSWFVAKDPLIIEKRTFFQSPWLLPLTIHTVMAVLAFLQSVSLGILFAYTFVEVERLEYPAGKVQASLILTLSERKEEQMRTFTFSVIIGATLGAIVFVPQLIGTPLIPLPWFDLTPLTQDILPGAIIGLSTNPISYGIGMIVPLNVSLCALISSLAIYVIGNYMFLTFFPKVFPGWVNDYYHGMTIAPLQYRSYLRIWLPVQFGVTIGAAIFYVLVIRKQVYLSFKQLWKIPKKGSTFPSLSVTLLLFLASTLVSSLLFITLVPAYNAYIVVSLTLGYSFLAALITSRALGIGAVSPTITWPWRVVTYFSGYNGFIAYDFSPAIEMGFSSQIVQSIKVAYLTETKPMDYVKLLVAGYVAALLLGIVFCDFFWRVAPIPSGAYPFTMLYWPQYMLEILMFSTRKLEIKPEVVLISIVASMGIVALESGLRRFGIAFSAIGFIIGVFQIPPITIAFLIGSILSNVVIPRLLPDWKNMLFTAVAGINGGLSITVGIGIALSLLGKAPWIWPW